MCPPGFIHDDIANICEACSSGKVVKDDVCVLLSTLVAADILSADGLEVLSVCPFDQQPIAVSGKVYKQCTTNCLLG